MSEVLIGLAAAASLVFGVVNMAWLVRDFHRRSVRAVINTHQAATARRRMARGDDARLIARAAALDSLEEDLEERGLL